MADKTKVLLLIESWGPGGAEKVVLELAKRIDRSRFQPIVGILHTGWLHQQLEQLGIETVMLNNQYGVDPVFLWKLWRLIKEKGVGLIHSHEFTMNVYGSFAAHLSGIPSLATVHGNGYYPEKKRRRAAYRVIASLPKTEVVTVSNFLKRYFCKVTGVDGNKVRMVYNGVDCSGFNGSFLKVDNRQEGPFIGTIGNLYPIKGHVYLIRAVSLVAKRFPDVRLFIAGKKTEYQQQLEKEAEKLNVRKNIDFLGFQDDVSFMLKKIDIFVLPSLQETFSIALIEAMAAKLPVIATKCGGPEEIITDGVNGFLVPLRDHQALAEKMLLVIDSSSLGVKLATKAREKVLSEFTIEKMVSSYQNLYMKTLE